MCQELFAEVRSEKCKIIGFTHERSDPFEGVDEFVEVCVGVALAHILLGQRCAVARGELCGDRRTNRSFEVNVKLGFGQFGDGGGK